MSNTLTAAARGVYPIAPTAFLPDGAIDWASLDRLMEHYRKIGCDGVTVLGMMGERRSWSPRSRWRSCARTTRVMAGLGLLSASRRQASPRCAVWRVTRWRRARPRDDRPAEQPAHRRPDRRLLRAGHRGDRPRRPLRDPGLSAADHGRHDRQRHPPHRHGQSLLRDAEGEDGRASRRSAPCAPCRRTGSLRELSIMVANGGLFLDFEMSRGADGSNTATPSPRCWSASSAPDDEGKRDEAHECSTRTCRCCATSSSRRRPRGSEIRADAPWPFSSEAQRKPAAASPPPPSRRSSICSAVSRSTTRSRSLSRSMCAPLREGRGRTKGPSATLTSSPSSTDWRRGGLAQLDPATHGVAEARARQRGLFRSDRRTRASSPGSNWFTALRQDGGAGPREGRGPPSHGAGRTRHPLTLTAGGYTFGDLDTRYHVIRAIARA